MKRHIFFFTNFTKKLTMVYKVIDSCIWTHILSPITSSVSTPLPAPLYSIILNFSHPPVFYLPPWHAHCSLLVAALILYWILRTDIFLKKTQAWSRGMWKCVLCHSWSGKPKSEQQGDTYMKHDNSRNMGLWWGEPSTLLLECSLVQPL